MKIHGSIEIAKPREVVVKYFADPSFLGAYQDGFKKKVLVKGVGGHNGAISEMHYEYGKRSMVLTETITANRLPDSFEATYYHKQMDNTMKCTFIDLGENRTKYEYLIEYTRIDWVLPRIMAILFPGVYRKQIEKWMRQYKEFVEKQ